jgi:archaellum component FlaG (FlaF/FlaG flagellin family)
MSTTDITAQKKNGKINIIDGKGRLLALLKNMGSATIMVDGKPVEVILDADGNIIKKPAIA